MWVHQHANNNVCLPSNVTLVTANNVHNTVNLFTSSTCSDSDAITRQEAGNLRRALVYLNRKEFFL